MMAKIVQGRGFKGVVNYVLDKDKAQLIYSEGIRTKDRESIIRSFIAQSQMNPISKPVAHISLNFSVQDKARLTDVAMAGIAIEYIKKMGYANTQYIIVGHSDREHPHVHLIINRIDNNGKRISDKSEKLRSTKVCMELTKKYGLYIAQGKEYVNRHRLKEPDKTKYEIYDALKAALPKCRSWKDLHTQLKQQGITISFKNKANTNEVQGIRFEKNGYIFNGSKIDRQFSYSKIDFRLKQNNRGLILNTQPLKQVFPQNQSSVLENVGSVLGGLFDIQPSGTDYDPDEAELLKQHKYKKKKRKGFRL
jgi:hypothetical protein